jgi:hypothetical protein
VIDGVHNDMEMYANMNESLIIICIIPNDTFSTIFVCIFQMIIYICDLLKQLYYISSLIYPCVEKILLKGILRGISYGVL